LRRGLRRAALAPVLAACCGCAGAGSSAKPAAPAAAWGPEAREAALSRAAAAVWKHRLPDAEEALRALGRAFGSLAGHNNPDMIELQLRLRRYCRRRRARCRGARAQAHARAAN